jgi:toxin-antitoxin system PIN domain toxin
VRAIDTGVLLCAVNRYAPEHARAAAVVEGLASGDRPWALPITVVHEFLRLVTHRHVAVRSLRPEHALGFLEPILRAPSARVLQPDAGHLTALREVLALLGPVAELPPGFDTAVLLREHDVRELLTSDSGMRRYRFLAIRDPLHGAPWTADEPRSRRYRRLSRRSAAGPAAGERG